jgi:hypothetical protein
MKPRTRPPRTPSKLSVSIHHQLNTYAIAAGAAGVGMLALVQPVEGKIVYTAAHKNAIAGIKLDLNHDGIADFKLCRSDNTYYHCIRTSAPRPPGFQSALLARPKNKLNGVVGEGIFASALVAGTPIGGKGTFPKSDSKMARGSFSGSTNYDGPWLKVTNRYLGLKFVIKGKIHYGWARLNVHWKYPQKAVLTGYAYETIPNKAIIAGATKEADDENQPADVSLKTNAPEPPTVGKLALGAPGLSIWRRKDELAAEPKGI